MGSPRIDHLTEMQRLLLLAEFWHDMTFDRSNGCKCATVIGQVLKWKNMWNEAIYYVWLTDDVEAPRDWADWYRALIEMIKHQPVDEALFSGKGDFGKSQDSWATPLFTECRLTALGHQLAEELSDRYPEYAKQK